MALVRPDFAVPPGAVTTLFVLEPLGPQHNAADLAAWTSSIAHIRATPGFAGRPWPDRPFSLEENETDLARHAEDFAKRTGFTYTVLDPASGEVVGCVYLYPPRRAGYDVEVRSWVIADRADLDRPLYQFVCEWLAGAWPFSEPDYAER
jgi:RimJ/RimL family protein N-acetyltransferase